MRRRPTMNLTTDPSNLTDLKAMSRATSVPQSRIADAGIRAELDRRAATLPADQRAAYEAARREEQSAT